MVIINRAVIIASRIRERTLCIQTETLGQSIIIYHATAGDTTLLL